MPDPEFDPTAPLAPLRPGELPHGLWVAPVYYQRGLAGARRVVWLRVQLVPRLLQAVVAATREGYGILVWDGWRSPELQETLWQEYREELAESTGLRGAALDKRARMFVSDPTAPDTPAHNTGGALDLTLCTLEGEPLEMGGNFDELTDRSNPDYYEHGGLSAEELLFRDRRRLLLDVMSSAGFWRFPFEWWHFEWGTAAWAAAVGGIPRFAAAVAPPE